MRAIDTSAYGPAARELIALAERERLPRTLPFGEPFAAVHEQLKAMTDQTISANRRVRMPHDAAALRAGLWLLFDYMDASHELSQNIATPSGSYWHAILHRREGDASNAKYWVARLGEHPVMTELLPDARELAVSSAVLSGELNRATQWDVGGFIDHCVGKPAGADEAILLDIQRREWLLLFDYNFRKAFA